MQLKRKKLLGRKEIGTKRERKRESEREREIRVWDYLKDYLLRPNAFHRAQYAVCGCEARVLTESGKYLRVAAPTSSRVVTKNLSNILFQAIRSRSPGSGGLS